MTKKIVHLVYSFGCGGLEKVIANLINHSSQYDVEHILISLTDSTAMLEQVHEDIKVYVINKKEGNDLSSHVKLYQLFKKLKPQVVNTYNFGTIEYHFIAKLAGVPVRVHSDHGRGGDDPTGKNKVHNIFRKFISSFISQYIVVSHDLYHWIVQDIKVAKKKVSLIFNGVEVPDSFQFKKNIPQNFVTVGRLDKVKNQRLLIDAFTNAVNTFDHFKHNTLNIVGDGPLFNNLLAQINSLKMDQHIKLLGFRADIVNVLNDSDVFVLSSVYEAMPMTILEAMAQGVPVICTNVGGISQFISEDYAWFVESNNSQQLTDKLNEVIDNKQLREEKVKLAYELVKNKYSIEHMTDEYMEKYQIQKIK